MRLRAMIFASLLLAGAPGAALGDAPAAPDAAKVRSAAEEFDAGRRAFKLKDYEDAAVHFENADRDAPTPEALRSAIRSRKEAKQLARAATLASLAIERYPDDEGLVAFAEQVIAAAEKVAGRAEISCKPACSLLVDGKLTPFGEAQTATAWLDPGAHEIVAGWSERRTQSAKVTVAAGGSEPLDFEAPPLPKAEPAAVARPEEEGRRDGEAEPGGRDRAGRGDEARSGWSPTVFYLGLGATALVGGIAAWSGADTVANPGKDRVRTECAGQGESCPAYQDGLSRQTRTNVLLGATAGAAVVTGVIGLFLTDWSSGEAPSTGAPPRLAPTVGLGDGVSLGAMGRF